MSEDYKVGYGKPPLKHRFPKGRSGNPKGRPKKKPPHLDIIALLDEPVRVQGAAKAELGGFEARLIAQARRAIAGHLRAAKAFLNACDRYGVLKEAARPPGNGVIIAPPGVDVHEWVKRGCPGASDGAEEAAQRARAKAEHERKARSRNPTRADIAHKVAYTMQTIEMDGVKKQVSTLELVLLRVKKAAIESDIAAFDLIERLSAKYADPDEDDDKRLGVIVLPADVPAVDFIREQIEKNKTRQPPEGCGELARSN